MQFIPPQLKKDEFRFVRVPAGQKNPIGTNWQTTNNHKHNDPALEAWVRNGGNYGVVGGHGNLIIIDFDNTEFQQKNLPLLPPTMHVKSGRGNIHAYYTTDDPRSFKIKNPNDMKDTWADIQGAGCQVIGAGSLHKNGNRYTLINDTPIAFIKRAQLEIIFGEYMSNLNDVKPKHAYGEDDIRDQIKNKISISDALKDFGIHTHAGRGNCDCPFHDSEHHLCFSYDDEKNGGVWHCFHCGKHGDIYTLYMMRNNKTFPDVKRELAQRLNLPLIQKFKKATKEYDFDYLEAADNFLDIQPLWYDAARNWWYWSDEASSWKRIDETDVMVLIDEHMDIQETVRGDVQACILRSLGRRSRVRAPKPMPPYWLQFKNVVYDLQTGRVRSATSEYFCTNPIPWEMGKSEDTPIINELFEQWVGKEYAPQLFEIMAFSIVPDYFVQRIFSLVGGGSNGKSTFLQVLTRFVGEQNCTSADLDLLCSSRFEPAKLYRKLVCTISETSFDKMNRTNKLKQLSGRDTISAEYKGKDPFDFVNYAKLLISTNTLPTTQDTTDGFYRRWLVIPFPNQFSEQRDVLASIPEQEYRNMSRKVIGILERMIKERKFTNEGTIEERRKRYETSSDPLKRFVDEFMVKDVDGSVTCWALRERFNAYCHKHGLRKWNEMEVGLWMRENGFERLRGGGYTDPVTQEVKRPWMYEGLVWKEGQVHIRHFDGGVGK